MTVAVSQRGGAVAAVRAAARDTPPDDALIARIGQGDRSAMRMLCARYQTPLYRWLLRLVHDEALAEELLSAVFLDVWRQAGPFDGSVSTWLLASGRRAAFWARERWVASTSKVAPTVVGSADDPHPVGQEPAARIRRSLAKLAPQDAQVIDLVYYHGRSVAQVAAILDVSRGVAKSRMRTARQSLAALAGV
jgi:RNA polymerase sigma-70 factor (ECF subfamily)